MRRVSSVRITSATAIESLPTVNGFDEFFGNLYHLNAEEEPELPGLFEGPGVPQEVRPARRAQVQGDRQG